MTTAMIWGASGSIGRALAHQLQAQGWTVIGIARDVQSLDPTLSYALAADVTKAHEVQEVVTAASFEVEGVDLWAYAVGDIASTTVSDMSPSAWHRLLDANLTGAYLTTYYSLPLLAPAAHLFYLGAVHERLRLPGLAAYAAAKAGLEAFAEALRKEQRKRKVTVVRPAAVNTSFWQKVPFRMPANALTPDAVAQRIVAAYAEGAQGILDINP